MASPILIFTTGFGEGHNSAARGLSQALAEVGSETEVHDPLSTCYPRLARRLQALYQLAINQTPKLWERFYRWTDHRKYERAKFRQFRKARRHIGDLLEDRSPAAVVTTYPFIAYLVDQAQRSLPAGTHRVPRFTIITDSVSVNRIWLEAPSEYFLVAEPRTERVLLDHGISPEKIRVFGFPVSPEFAALASEGPTRHGNDRPRRILYVATSKSAPVRKITGLLCADPDNEVTLVLGKHFESLKEQAEEARRSFPGRVEIVGWTERMPALMSTHHVIVSKAGGATVHESLAARTPMIIRNIVPGQEEGNAELVLTERRGLLAETPEEIVEAVRMMFADEGALWETFRSNIEQISRPRAALDIADFIREVCAKDAP